MTGTVRTFVRVENISLLQEFVICQGENKYWHRHLMIRANKNEEDYIVIVPFTIVSMGWPLALTLIVTVMS